MIEPICDKCKRVLNEFGGILLSPPNSLGFCKKSHLCKKCYEIINNMMIDEQPICPGSDCPMCNGACCDFCGAGCWNNHPDEICEHDVIDRHIYRGKY